LVYVVNDSLFALALCFLLYCIIIVIVCDIVWWHDNHYVMVCVCGYVGVYVSTIKRKLLTGMTWNLAQ